MRLTLNLASIDPALRRRRRRYAFGALVLTILLSAGHALLYRTLDREARALRVRGAQVEEGLKKLEARLFAVEAPPKADLTRRITLYNEIVERASFSWSRLLFELEKAIPQRVRLTEIQPEFTSRLVRLRGKAASFEDLLTFVRGLEARTSFSEVFVLQHALSKEKGGPGRIAFTIGLTYRGREA
ncbi:MAG: PilN domain-containing protein [Candidatus Methylomirabilales bacterium]